MKTKILLTVFLMLMLATGRAPAQLNNETKEQKAERMKWWTEARFGMFIHWGLYSMPARHEWVRNYEQISNEQYQKYFDLFDPDMFNPREWARCAKEAGMKYFVITTKHHEGFCLWNSKFTDYKATNTPAKRDLLREMVDAFRSEGIKVGFYYSLIDWHHPDFTIDRVHPLRNSQAGRDANRNRNMNLYREYIINQVTELLTNYGPVDCLFLDYSYPGPDGKGKADWNSEDIYRLVRKLQPKCIINDRLDLMEEGGWDFRTPEQFMPREWVTYKGNKVPWETCQTFSGSWGYFRDEYTWKDVHQLIAMLIETVSKGGNLLLNVGPTSRGTFDERAVDRLKGMGEWMKVNSRSIYGCTAAPESIRKPDNCFLTWNPVTNRLYIHILEWPFKALYLPGLKGKVKYAQLLNDGSEIKFTERTGAWMNEMNKDENALTLELPVRKPSVEIPVIELILN